MPPLKNQRQELFCELLFASRGTNTPAYECAIGAGYSLKRARQTAAELVTYRNIEVRLAELTKKAEDALIADVVERKKTATEIVRGRLADFVDEKGEPILDKKKLKSAAVSELTITRRSVGDNVIDTTTRLKLRDPLSGVDILNKMDKIYATEGTGNVNINVVILSNVPRPEYKVIEQDAVQG